MASSRHSYFFLPKNSKDFKIVVGRFLEKQPQDPKVKAEGAAGIRIGSGNTDKVWYIPDEFFIKRAKEFRNENAKVFNDLKRILSRALTHKDTYQIRIILREDVKECGFYALAERTVWRPYTSLQEPYSFFLEYLKAMYEIDDLREMKNRVNMLLDFCKL